MMPNVAGERSTRRQIFAYSVLLAAAGVSPAFLGMTTPVYGAIAAILGVEFIRRAWHVLAVSGEGGTHRPDRALFRFSIQYLFLIFAALFLESIWGRLHG